MKPISGKTYSLYAGGNNTENYFKTISKLADFYLKKYPDEKELLSILQKTNSSGGFLNKFLKKEKPEPQLIKKSLAQKLSKYTVDVSDYLRSLSFMNMFDTALRTDELQYYLYMLEIEMVNRIYKRVFKNCEYKVALFPHCLRDFRKSCLSASTDFEHVCKECTTGCFINLGSKLLKEYHIKPYISVTINQKKLFNQLKKKHSSIAMLGIACIPELARGMRLCLSLGIPAVGIPLDANNCARWRGKAYETTFNLKELEKLIT